MTRTDLDIAINHAKHEAESYFKTAYINPGEPISDGAWLSYLGVTEGIFRRMLEVARFAALPITPSLSAFSSPAWIAWGIGARTSAMSIVAQCTRTAHSRSLQALRPLPARCTRAAANSCPASAPRGRLPAGISRSAAASQSTRSPRADMQRHAAWGGGGGANGAGGGDTVVRLKEDGALQTVAHIMLVCKQCMACTHGLQRGRLQAILGQRRRHLEKNGQTRIRRSLTADSLALSQWLTLAVSDRQII